MSVGQPELRGTIRRWNGRIYRPRWAGIERTSLEEKALEWALVSYEIKHEVVSVTFASGHRSHPNNFVLWVPDYRYHPKTLPTPHPMHHPTREFTDDDFAALMSEPEPPPPPPRLGVFRGDTAYEACWVDPCGQYHALSFSFAEHGEVGAMRQAIAARASGMRGKGVGV